MSLVDVTFSNLRSSFIRSTYFLMVLFKEVILLSTFDFLYCSMNSLDFCKLSSSPFVKVLNCGRKVEDSPVPRVEKNLYPVVSGLIFWITGFSGLGFSLLSLLFNFSMRLAKSSNTCVPYGLYWNSFFSSIITLAHLESNTAIDDK